MVNSRINPMRVGRGVFVVVIGLAIMREGRAKVKVAVDV